MQAAKKAAVILPAPVYVRLSDPGRISGERTESKSPVRAEPKRARQISPKEPFFIFSVFSGMPVYLQKYASAIREEIAVKSVVKNSIASLQSSPLCEKIETAALPAAYDEIRESANTEKRSKTMEDRVFFIEFIGISHLEIISAQI